MKQKNKLGVTYSLFSGEELLKGSILSIRNQVDYINVVYQDYSWVGEKSSENVEILLSQLLEQKLIDKIIKFDFHFSDNPKKTSRLQCKKRNIGIKDLVQAGCSHIMLMDVDEYYYEKEFKNAKDFVYNHHITHSVCSIYDYRILPIYRMKEARDYCVSFIFKLTLLSKVIAVSNLPCKIDSYRTFIFIPLIHKFYYLNMVNMHHMTGIRKDYTFKVRNSISNFSEKGREAVKHYLALQNRMESMKEEDILSEGYIKVHDDFGILKEWE